MSPEPGFGSYEPRSGAGGAAPDRGHEYSALAESQRRVVHGGEACQGEGGEHEPEVAQCDVVVAGEGEQVDDDPGQPARDDVGAVARLERDEHAGDDLDGADEVHEVLAGAGGDVVDPGGEVDRPVDQDVEELVEAERD